MKAVIRVLGPASDAGAGRLLTYYVDDPDVRVGDPVEIGGGLFTGRLGVVESLGSPWPGYLQQAVRARADRLDRRIESAEAAYRAAKANRKLLRRLRGRAR